MRQTKILKFSYTKLLSESNENNSIHTLIIFVIGCEEEDYQQVKCTFVLKNLEYSSEIFEFCYQLTFETDDKLIFSYSGPKTKMADFFESSKI